MGTVKMEEAKLRENHRSSRAGRLGPAAAVGDGWAFASAGPETVRFPNEVAHWRQRNSYSSPDGKTSNSFSRTGWLLLHLGQ